MPGRNQAARPPPTGLQEEPQGSISTRHQAPYRCPVDTSHWRCRYRLSATWMQRNWPLQTPPTAPEERPPHPLHRCFLPPSHTHRHHCELARAPGGSRADGRFPPRPFVWGISKIDCGRAIGSQPTHGDRHLCHACRQLPVVGGEASCSPGRRRGRGSRGRVRPVG